MSKPNTETPPDTPPNPETPPNPDQVQITVPQKDGEIVARRGGAEPVTYKVTNHAVSVDEADAGWFAAQFDGEAKLASGSPAGPTPQGA